MPSPHGSITPLAALPCFRQDLVFAPDVESELGFAKRIKRSVLSIFGAAGGFSVVKGSRWRTNRLLVLGYHGISMQDEHLWAPALFMNPHKFESRMELLCKRGYSVIGLDEGLRRLDAGDLPPASVSLTFDDGLFCFYKQALPILERMGFPSTLYLTSFYSEFQEPVFDVLCSYILWKSQSSRLDLGPLTGDAAVFHLKDEVQRHAVQRIIMSYVNREPLKIAEKVHFAEQLSAQLSFDLDFVRHSRLLTLMTGTEVADAAARGVDVELHTHRHRVPLDRRLFLREIEDNRSRIEVLTGRKPVHFCYPSGYHNASLVPWLKECGIQSATTCDPGMVSRGTPPFLIPRLIDVSSLGQIEFEAWLSGVAAAVPARRRDQPLDSRRPAGFIEQARSACRKALIAPTFTAMDAKLREFDPSGNLRKAWLRQLWTQGVFPSAAHIALQAARQLEGESLFGPERLVLLQAALESLDRLTEARLDLSTQALMSRQYEFFADPGRDWIHRFDPAEYSYRVYAGMSLLDRIQAGPLDWETPRFPRSLALKLLHRRFPDAFRFIATELRGLKSVIFTHLALFQAPSATQEDLRASYVRIARCLELRPELKAIVTESWLSSPEMQRIDPHHAWTAKLFEENGGIIDLGKPPEGAAFPARGSQGGTQGIILWPRRAVLEWLSKQPDCADLQ